MPPFNLFWKDKWFLVKESVGINSTENSLSPLSSKASPSVLLEWIPHSGWISDSSQVGKAKVQRKTHPPGLQAVMVAFMFSSSDHRAPLYLLHHGKHSLESFSLLISNLWINDSSSGLLTLSRSIAWPLPYWFVLFTVSMDARVAIGHHLSYVTEEPHKRVWHRLSVSGLSPGMSTWKLCG